MPSHPTWVCGLKQTYGGSVVVPDTSHPTWVCGLKQQRVRDEL